MTLMSTTLYFVRHGEAENPSRIAYGRMPGFHLSASGIDQAEKLATYFALKPIVAIYTSPLERTFETANIISEKSKGLVPIHMYDLIEVDSALWQGLTTDQLFKNESYEKFISNSPDRSSGESLAQVAKRMLNAALTLCKEHSGKELICVSHEYPILTLKLKLQNKPLEEMRHLNAATGSITKLVLDDSFKLVESDYIELE